ncbi:MAG: hypothetical protein Q8L00_01135 [Deltaproteobacteria bacterium]|nr:hypothetical protein [Deltaproteobacteria bacterium]
MTIWIPSTPQDLFREPKALGRGCPCIEPDHLALGGLRQGEQTHGYRCLPRADFTKVFSVISRNTHHISTSELTADQAVVERAGCFANFHTYIGYKVLEFSTQTLTGVTIRRSEK